MHKLKAIRGVVMAVAVAGPLSAAMATNGYFSHGFGIKAKGLGGAGIALPLDAMAAATNPAGAVSIGNRVDFGMDYFMPDRTTTMTANSLGTLGVSPGEYRSGQREFFVPEFGYNRAIGDDMAFALVVYGNGGMNTAYDKALTGTTNTFSNLEQMFIAPTIAKKVGIHSFGASLNVIRQTFEARGLENFDNANSAYQGFVTNNGQDISTGYGFKLGWTAEISPSVTVGATYQTRSKMTKFSKYKGLFAEEGGFDIPETYGFGVALKATPKMTVAADISQINYGSVKSLANQGTRYPQLSASTKMGLDTGAGFGWQDMTVLKIGVSYEYSNKLTLRAGYNYGKMPITRENTYFNILAPATVEQHLTLGATWTLDNKSELTLTYMEAANQSISGVATGNGNSVPGYPVDLKMNQRSIGLAYGWRW